jgi:hypothetical protein
VERAVTGDPEQFLLVERSPRLTSKDFKTNDLTFTSMSMETTYAELRSEGSLRGVLISFTSDWNKGILQYSLLEVRHILREAKPSSKFGLFVQIQFESLKLEAAKIARPRFAKQQRVEDQLIKF